MSITPLAADFLPTILHSLSLLGLAAGLLLGARLQPQPVPVRAGKKK